MKDFLSCTGVLRTNPAKRDKTQDCCSTPTAQVEDFAVAAADNHAAGGALDAVAAVFFSDGERCGRQLVAGKNGGREAAGVTDGGQAAHSLVLLFGFQVVPVEVPGAVHRCGKGGKEQQAAGEQGVFLALQQEVEHGVGEREDAAEGQGAARTAQHGAEVARDEAVAGKRRKDVGGGKADLLAEREQEQVEDDDRCADEGVLHGVDAQAAQGLEEEAAAEGDDQEEDGIFAAALGEAVEVEAVIQCLDRAGLGRGVHLGDVLARIGRVVLAVVDDAAE